VSCACKGDVVKIVNVATCAPDEVIERGAFRRAYFDLTERLGASVIGATVFEIRAGDRFGPYHYHHGVEEWMYVVSGAPILRAPSGERMLEPGELVAFSAGPEGAHTYDGPGRVVVFSAGARGWGEGFVTVYPDSDKIGAAPGVMFRRADALDSWRGEAPAPSPISSAGVSAIDLLTAAVDGTRVISLGPRLGAQTWAATLFELVPGEATEPYHYQWNREQWALVLSGSPTLRHPAGEQVLAPGDIVCFPEGPTGAHRVSSPGDERVRLIVFSTPPDGAMSAFYPDDGTVVVRVSNHEGFRFRLDDQIEDYWDGEPGAGPA
jgi:uncharacterized cupin superfamily protein